MPRGFGVPFAILVAFTLTALCLPRDGLASAPVLIVTSDRGGAYAETEAALRRGLADEVPDSDIATTNVETFASASLNGTRVIVTLGTPAAFAVGERNPDAPVLNTLLPQQAYYQLPGRSGGAPTSAIFMDQPAERQIAALAELLPGWRSLALIAGPHTRTLASGLALDARARGFDVQLVEIESDRELYAAMRSVLATPAVLIALPDRVVYNNHTVQNILLTTYRQRSPVVGFSPAYVRAGAVAALYSTPQQIGAQTAEVVRAVLRGGALPSPQYPRDFEIGINHTVARSLGIRVESAEDVRDRLRSREPGR